MKYPLYWQYRDQVAGDGFTAAVVAQGRCLMTFEDGEWWIRSVEPGGFCAHGATIEFAMKAFQIAWTEVLEDCAFERSSINDFEREVRSLFSETQISRLDEMDWQEARDQVRCGKPLTDPIARMKQVVVDLEAFVQIVPIEQAMNIKVEPMTAEKHLGDDMARAA